MNWLKVFKEKDVQEKLGEICNKHDLRAVRFEANWPHKDEATQAFYFYVYTADVTKDWPAIREALGKIVEANGVEEYTIYLKRGVIDNAQWEDSEDITQDKSGPDLCGLGGDA